MGDEKPRLVARLPPRHRQESVDELHHEGVADARRRRGRLLLEWDPREVLRVVERMQAAAGDQGGFVVFGMTHPRGTDRCAEVRARSRASG